MLSPTIWDLQYPLNIEQEPPKSLGRLDSRLGDQRGKVEASSHHNTIREEKTWNQNQWGKWFFKKTFHSKWMHKLNSKYLEFQ